MTNNVIIFDLDGTLLEEDTKYYQSFVKSFSKHKLNLKISQKDLLEMKLSGMNSKSIIKTLVPENTFIAEINKLRKFLMETEDLLSMQKTFPETLPSLKILVNKFTLVIATNRKNQSMLLKQLKKLKLIEYFQKILCKQDFKSKFEMLRFIQSTYHSSQINFITDTVNDVKEAKKLNINIYGVAKGLNSHEMLMKENIIVFENLSRFCEYLIK